jgi:membrane-bound ClpP family serine protease
MIISAPIFWFIAGTIMVLIEVFAIPGLGFLFAGLAAITLGGLISFDVLNEVTTVAQLAYFFFFTSIWWAALWIPLRKFTKNKKGKTFENLVGTYGTVDDKNGLEAGKIGHIKWSGARMRAIIKKDSTTQKIEEGSTVWVHSQNDGVLEVDLEKGN